MVRLAIACAALAVLLTGCAAQEDPGCVGNDVITPICGFLPPEDVEVVPGGEALVVGGFSLDNENGDLRVLRLSDQAITRVYPPDSVPASAIAREPWGDPKCPGPPNDGFAAHGIHLSPNEYGTYTLLAVNHTGREAVEWFELREDDGHYSAAWRGCVIIDEPYWVNDIAMLPAQAGGGFVASHMMPREISATIFDRPPNDRVETGFNIQWQPESGWIEIPGTEGALPNGVHVSEDGAVLYSNHYLANQVVAYERATGKRLWTASLGAAPDNTSMTPDGMLLIAAHRASLRRIRDDCMLTSAPFCGLPFSVFLVNPEDGAVTLVLESEGPPFGGATVAVQVGDSIYMGAFAGDRLGRIAAPVEGE
jgi:hypothetical protein